VSCIACGKLAEQEQAAAAAAAAAGPYPQQVILML